MKLKLGTRVLVNGVETFISELHTDIQRGVYKVRTSNPTYEFTKHPATGDWFNKGIVLQEAPKYGGYQVGDRIFCINKGKGIVKEIRETGSRPVRVQFDYFKSIDYHFMLSGSFNVSKEPVLKKLRVKFGEKK